MYRDTGSFSYIPARGGSVVCLLGADSLETKNISINRQKRALDPFNTFEVANVCFYTYKNRGKIKVVKSFL